MNLQHSTVCRRPQQLERPGWDGAPEQSCPSCGRTAGIDMVAPVEDTSSARRGHVERSSCEVRMVQPDPARGLLAFVQIEPATVEVRVRVGRRGPGGWRWECDACGRNLRPACPHVVAIMAAIGRPLDQVDRKGRP